MKIVKDECCDCAVPAYPCIGNTCPYKNVTHYYCDDCGVEGDEEFESLYYYEGSDLCINCIIEKLEKVI